MRTLLVWAGIHARRVLYQPMNLLLVGRDKVLPPLDPPFLLIDDEIDLPIPKNRKVTVLDFTKHSFNPLRGMDYKKAREFISVLDAVFPEGENTLTKKTSNFVLLNALLSKTTRLDKLIRPNKKDASVTDAYQKIQTLLFSPVLDRVLCRPTNFSFDGTILARLNRAELGDFDCFVLGNLLISQYKGQVVIPDFGFYGEKHHTALIRQNRLIAGVNYLDESPLKSELLLMDKLGQHCLLDDAKVLADYAGIARDTNAYNEFVQRSMGE